MREIKFRAWDSRPNGKCMVDWITINQTAFNFRTETPLLWTVFHDPHLILMQYTGLKDKNGKRIYEGDIVTAINRLFEHKVEQNVLYLNGCFMFGNWNAHEFFNKHTSIEVIGNIYENPELIKGEIK